jgi:hypothetical protein
MDLSILRFQFAARWRLDVTSRRAVLYDGDRTKDVGAYVAVDTHSTDRSGLDSDQECRMWKGG